MRGGSAEDNGWCKLSSGHLKCQTQQDEEKDEQGKIFKIKGGRKESLQRFLNPIEYHRHYRHHQYFLGAHQTKEFRHLRPAEGGDSFTKLRDPVYVLETAPCQAKRINP